MRHEILGGASFPVLEVTLGAGESVVSEAGAMAWMEGEVAIETSTRGGVFAAIKRAALAGETLFQNTYRAGPAGGRVALVPGQAGEIVAQSLQGELLLQRGAFLAASEGIECSSRIEGLKGILAQGLFVLRAIGSGTLFFSGYGSVEPVDVDGDYTIDNGYVVAWEPGLAYRLTAARRVRSFLFSDQVLVGFSGRGRLWVASRSPHSLADWVYPFRRVRSKKGGLQVGGDD